MDNLGSWADAQVEPEEMQYEEPEPEPEPAVEVGSRPAPRREHKKVPFPTHPPYQAFIGNLSFSCREDDVNDFLRPAKVTEIRFINDRNTGKFKGFCYVDFEDADSLRQALELNGREMFGRTVRVDIGQPQNNRGRGSFKKRGGPRDGHREYREPREHGFGQARDHGFRDQGRDQGFRDQGRDQGFRDQGRDQGFPARRGSRHNDRAARSPAHVPLPDPENAPERPPTLRLKDRLKKRSEGSAKPTQPNSLARSSSNDAKKSNPFGNARPREVILAERVPEPKKPSPKQVQIKRREPQRNDAKSQQPRGPRQQPAHAKAAKPKKKAERKPEKTADGFETVQSKKGRAKKAQAQKKKARDSDDASTTEVTNKFAALGDN